MRDDYLKEGHTLAVKEYWRRRTEKLLAKGKVSWLEIAKIDNQAILTSLINAKSYAKGKLLDAGCGNKHYEPIFSNFVDTHVGIDLPISESATKSEKKVDVYGSVLNMPFKSESFDTVLSTEVLEHVPEPRKCLKEMYRVLKREGCLVLTAPMTWRLHEVPHDYYRYTKYGLKYLAESVGFEIVYIKARCGFWGVIGQKLSIYVYHLRGIPRSLIGEGAKRSLGAFIQIIFSLLDNINKDERETLGYTLGYILVAKKVNK
jgi:SAM-dependent methyltransferase